MSLRDALRATVACCTPIAVQRATTGPERATADATTVQQLSCTPPAEHPDAHPRELHELQSLCAYEDGIETQLKAAKVARCAHQGLQHATSTDWRATGRATPMQHPSCTGGERSTGIRPRSCTACRHRTVHGTCREPVAAGLSRRFAIRWPEPGHGATCPAWKRDPYEAQTLVHIEAVRRLWTAAERDAWLADADDDPAAVIDALRAAT